MNAMYCIYSFATAFLVTITRVVYLIFFRHNKQRKQTRKSPVRTMIILGSGGHTAEILRIAKQLNIENYSPRIYVHAHTDTMSVKKTNDLEGDNLDYKIVEIHRSREVRQSYLTSIYSTVRATLASIPLLWTECPELILCNGPGTCVPLCVTAFIFKVFCITQTTVVFVESFCRVKTFSLTGKILYYLADYIMCEDDSIRKLVTWEILLEDLQNYIPIEIKIHLIPVALALKEFTEDSLNWSREYINISLTVIEACLDRTWEMLNSGYWKFVPIEYRYCYTICIVIKATLLEFEYESDIKKCTKTKRNLFKNIIQQIDKGILMGAPLPSMPSLLTKIASKLNNSTTMRSPETSTWDELIISSDSIYETIPPEFSEVIFYDEPSMESFYREMFMPKSPGILKGCIKHWKALKNWRNLNYLARIAGSRTVPIEIGSRYTENDWTQHLINFADFLQKHISVKNDKVGYLAQHQLFEQIPELKDDFTIPEYCNFTDSEEADQPDINAWFGPGGTVSPLHFDPKNNLLCQVFGYKKIILYNPNDTSYLYPYDGRLLNNTAQVDPMNPDYKTWPDFAKAKGIMCYLKPGEMLYIPPNWWHHVTALSPSFSISFWWS